MTTPGVTTGPGTGGHPTYHQQPNQPPINLSGPMMGNTNTQVYAYIHCIFSRYIILA